MVTRALLWLGLRALAGFMCRLCQMRKRQLYQECRERICHLLLRHTQRLTCNRSTVAQSTKALLSAAPPDARWAKWASLLTSAWKRSTCKTTQTQKRFWCWQNFIYMHKTCAILYHRVWLQRQDRHRGEKGNKLFLRWLLHIQVNLRYCSLKTRLDSKSFNYK